MSACMKSPAPYGLSDKYWDSLSAEHQALFRVIRPMPAAPYTVDWGLGDLEDALSRIEADVKQVGGSFELVPDFQRGHVWTDEQRTAFVEALIRKSTTGRILFNCPGWVQAQDDEGDIPDNTFQCIDGLQRLTAVRKFLAGEVRVFGGMVAADLRGSPFDTLRMSCRLQIGIYGFKSRAELLRFYLDLNFGGTAHAPQEIERVKGLLAQAAGN